MKNILTSVIGTSLNTLSYIAPQQTGRIGFRLFCRPLRPRLKPKYLEYLRSAENSDIYYKGKRTRVYRWGKGVRHVLFIHGWQSHSYRWKPYIDALDPEEFSVFALDAPGHGQSSGSFLSVPLFSQIIRMVIEQHGPFEVMTGHSLGSFTLLHTLFHYPEFKPEKLILLAPPGEAEEFLGFYQDTLNLSDRTVQQTRNHFEKVFHQSPAYFSAMKFARDLRVPGLIIHDEGDTETSSQNARNIHSVWPQSRLIISQGAGHNLRSPEVVDEVIRYIRQTN